MSSIDSGGGARKPTSRSSSGSVASNVSLGIGDSRGSANPNKDVQYVKLRPSAGTNNASCLTTYDCLVYVIVCKQHDKVAVTHVDSELLWFPFVAREGRNWKKVSADGLSALLGSQHADGTVLRKPPEPADYKIYTMELVRLQGVQLGWAERMAQLVLLTKCSNTCDPVNNLTWVDVAELKASLKYVFWGPEYRLLDNLSYRMARLDVVELNSDQIYGTICSTSTTNMLATLFQSCSISADMICDLHEDYLSHTYPSLFMTLPSFGIYLQKLGFSGQTAGCKFDNEATLIKAIYKSCLRRPNRTNKEDYLDFLDVCYAVVVMDPKTPTEKPRVRFLFDFYNSNDEPFITGKDIDRLAEDNKTSKLAKKLSLHELERAFEGGKLPQFYKTCRLAQSAFTAVTKHNTKSNDNKSVVESKAKSTRSRFICPTCRVKKLEFGQHCVTIDTTGRSVDPMIILNDGNTNIPTNLTGKYLYSMECSFSTNSVGNIYFDYIRNRRLKLPTTDPSDQPNFFGEFISLCEQVALLVKHEPKIVKRQSPAVVIGDIQGSLESLLAMETQFWRTIPVQGDDLIFLGNYSGNGSITGQAIEVLVYLFAAKYICPSKVVLLRGIQETRAYNEKILLPECKTRFGNELGKRIWEAANGVFDQLPYIAVLNESVVCISSGIPKDAAKLRLSVLFDNVSKDCATFQEVMTNMPDRTTDTTKVTTRAMDDIQFKPLPLMPNAFTFSLGAFRKFIELNQFAYMIRSNELLSEGYQVCFGRRCITIESNNSIAVAAGRKKAMVAIINHPRAKIQLAQIEYPRS